MDMKFKYGLDERPPLGELVLLGLQWLAITCPTVLIFGKAMAGLQPGGPGEQVIFPSGTANAAKPAGDGTLLEQLQIWLCF